jgi:hypothetical protein
MVNVCLHPPSRFERETLHTMKQTCAAQQMKKMAMNYDEAYNLVKETTVVQCKLQKILK